MDKSQTVRIVGAGPTGAVLALSLANSGLRVAINDSASAGMLLARSRAYAITHSSRRLLQSINLWNDLQSYLTPFEKLRIEDRELHRSVVFDSGDLSKMNIHQKSLGWILDHKPFMEILIDRLNSHPNVLFQLACSSDASLSGYDLIIAADGGFSRTRDKWDIGTWQINYRQGCLTSKVLIRGAEPHMAYETFRSEGPLALLPMGGDIFQVVWSAPFSLCKQRAALSNSALLDLLAGVLPEGLQPDSIIDQSSSFPLELAIAHRLHRGRGILVGESGHRYHPVGGQGLNVCWRDVSTLIFLISSISQRKGTLKHMPSKYSWARYIDIFLMAIFTDLTIRLYSNRLPLNLLVRKLIIWALKHFQSLRRVLLTFMTDGPFQSLRFLPK